MGVFNLVRILTSTVKENVKDINDSWLYKWASVDSVIMAEHRNLRGFVI